MAHTMEERWHAFVENDRLFLYRSWTGRGVYEAQFVPVAEGWRISEAVVTGDAGFYRRGNDTAESMQLLWLINGVLLHYWDDALWSQVQRHRWLP